MRAADFIEKQFRSFYEENYSLIEPPSMMEKREFGFVLRKQGMVRHKNFGSKTDLEVFLRNHAPIDAYYSCAYYDAPEYEMEEKGWLGADLVFDIDADHISTTCNKTHDEWMCGNADCNLSGRGLAPQECPVCMGQRFEVKTWPCEECLSSAKAETVRLLGILAGDFGFSEHEIHVFFSGHRGYHIHVESETARTLDTLSRKEIADYVWVMGLNTGFSDRNDGSSAAQLPPSGSGLDNLGRSRQVDRVMSEFVSNAKEEDYKALGLTNVRSSAILENKGIILKHWNEVGPYRSTRNVGPGSWRRIYESVMASISSKVDTVVTTDTHRLIRLNGTLHGKTGFRKVECPVKEIEAFDPFKSAVAFKKGAATVLVSSSPKFRLGDSTFGPYKRQKVELPNAAAIFLVCKGRGEVVEQNV